ncbi:MAG: hypothetical protein ACREMH_04725 [Gemmatimonadales bacterium]
MDGPSGQGLWALVLAAGEGRADLAQALAVVESARVDGIVRGAVAVIPAGRTDLLDEVIRAGMLPLLDPGEKPGVASALRLGLEFLSDPNLEPAAAAAVILPADGWATAVSLAHLAARWREGGATAFRPAGLPAPLLLDRAAWPLLQRLQGARAVRALRDVKGFPAVPVPV